jgi:hypothetical protein
MRSCRNTFGKNCSGQLLVVAALAIAILISSTTIYVYEVSRETNGTDARLINDFVLALKQSTINAMETSLANVSNGGERTVLTTNLDELSQAFRSMNRFGICQLDSTVVNDSTYDSGTWLSWNTSNPGVSSAYANFTLSVYSAASTVTTDYAVNITTTLAVNGFYTSLGDETKLVNLTCKIYNEDQAALAENITLFYENLGSWIEVDSSNNLIILDCGNGTYLISFTATTSSDPVQVSTYAYDLRNILVQANTTCYAP